MAKQSSSISGDEMTLRLHSPKFFQELIDSRTASLQAAGDPEALTAWKQQVEQKNQLWNEIVQNNPQVQQQVLDREMFEETVRRYAQEFSKVAPEINEEVFHESISDILRQEQDSPWDHNAPPLDMRHVVADEIAKHQAKEQAQKLDDMNLEGKSFGVDAKAEQEKVLAKLGQDGKELHAEVTPPTQENTQKTEQTIKTPKQKIKPPEQED